MANDSDSARPTPDCPLLIGLLVDVSGSMMSSIENRSGRRINRLEGFQDALDGLVVSAGKLSQSDSNARVAPLLKLFAYGFGFGNLISSFFGGSNKRVRDLLQLSNSQSSTVPLDKLTGDWAQYKSNVERMAVEMFGNTPMLEGLEIAYTRFLTETRQSRYFGQPVLFLLSDGEPSDANATEIASVAKRIKNAGVLIVSCYVTSDDITEARHLYRSPLQGWPEGAALMLECASSVPDNSSFSSYLEEYNWIVERDGKLFTQINQSEVLAEFMNLLLSPLEPNRNAAPTLSGPRAPAPDLAEPAIRSHNPKRVRVFVSYSHVDSEYVSSSGLLGYLSGLVRDGVDFWHDERLVAGDAWDARIREEIENSQIALVLVSQTFLNSDYCQNVEISSFLTQRARSGLKIFPVIVSPCDWKSHRWISSTQFEPRGGKTIEADFKDRGNREALYLSILNQLRSLAQAIRGV
jgi:hypothetical protein